MGNRLASLAAFSLVALASGAQTPTAPPTGAPPTAAPTNPDPAAAARSSAPPTPQAAEPTSPPELIAPKALGSPSSRAHLDAAAAFLKSLTHTSRTGDASAKAWGELKDLAGDKVPVNIAGVNHLVDVGGKTSDVQLLSFSKLSTWRDGNDIKGVAVGLLDFKILTEEHKGAGKLSMTKSADGKWTVQSIDVE